MTIALLLLTVQAAVILYALVFGRKEDSRFEGDKLIYRS
jgi:hypothetical protein